jgi:hypothetical protein
MTDILERIAKLEQAVFCNIDKVCIRYIVFTDNNTRVLASNGFKKLNELGDNTIKLFQHTGNIKDYIENHSVYRRYKIKVKKVKVTYEFLEEVEVFD